MTFQQAARAGRKAGRQAGRATRQAARCGGRALGIGLRSGARRYLPEPPPIQGVPEGRIVDLPGRDGSTFVVDMPGPTPDAPTVVLLHALGCTAYLTWAPLLETLNQDYRVVAFDLRWHGRGIRSPKFRFEDCADDVPAVMDALGIEQAVVVGYSMGGAIAQLTWVRHRHRVSGLVLCSTARNYRGGLGERMFFPFMTAAMDPMSSFLLEKVERIAAGLPDLPSADAADLSAWGMNEVRSTSAWTMPAALGELGRFNSKSWITGVDVPTAVVITEKDRAIPARRQHRLGASIPGAQVYGVEGGHTSLFMRADRWQPVFLEALAGVVARIPADQVAAVL